MLNRSWVIVAALMLFAVVCSCAPEPRPSKAAVAKDRIDAAKRWCQEMRLTPLSVVCGEYRVPGVSHERVQCDVRTLEIGVIPLTCGAYGFLPKCRLSSV